MPAPATDVEDINAEATRLYIALKLPSPENKGEFLDAVFNISYRRLIGYIRNRLRVRRPDDEDVFQETIFRFAKRIPDLNEVLLMPWLFRLASNFVIDQRRKARRHSETQLDQHHAQIAEGDAEKNLAKRDLEAAFAALPSKLKDVAHQHFIEGESVSQIARDLGVERSRIARYIQKAVQHLAKNKTIQEMILMDLRSEKENC